MMHVNGQKSIEELNKALQNVKYLDQFDQHLNSAYDYSQKAWQDRLDFLNTDQSQPAQQFNILLNYFVLNSMTLSPNIHNLQQSASAYTQMNVMSYQIPVDAYQVYTKAQNKIAEILQVTPAMVVSEIQQLRKNATVDKINQASLDIHNNIQEILNFKYEFKVLNVTIFTVEMPKQIVNFVNDALKKSGMSDTFEALQFLMTANAKGGSIPLAADFNQVKAYQNSNQYAKLMMGLSEALSKRFSSDYGLSQEQAYYAITYMLAHQLNHNI
jgi:predicted transcriptional regulator